MTLTPEDFEAWRDAPLTRLVGRFLGEEMAKTRRAHDDHAWAEPLAPAQHAVYRERYETLEWIQGLTFEEIDAWMQSKQETE
jgi:hypothetical protein